MPDNNGLEKKGEYTFHRTNGKRHRIDFGFRIGENAQASIIRNTQLST